MKYILHLIKFSFFCILTVATFSGCGTNSSDFTGDAAEIDTEHGIITFQVSSGQWSDVIFSHKTHAEQYLNNDCFNCHSHTDVRDNTIWNCNTCHSADDSKDLCANDAEGHACWMLQCQQCHETVTPDPAPDCESCHSTVATGIFIDSPVEGLFFLTATEKGITDSKGTFRYQNGQTITFSIGNTVIGSGSAKSIMTPVDLVNGASDETDPTVTNISRFLQTLDENGNHADGIKIPITVLDYSQNPSISFASDTSAFANNSNLQGFLRDLNENNVFTDGRHSLISENQARTNLFSTLRQFHSPPLADKAGINGTLAVSQTVTGKYTYSDTDGDAEKGTSYQWYRDDNPGGVRASVIAGATSMNYTSSEVDRNKYLIFEVTPADRFHAGTAVKSAAAGPVNADPANSAPTASDCVVQGGALNTYFVLTGSYNYNDVDGDTEADSTFEWYRDDDANPGGETLIATSLTYSPVTADATKYLKFKVTPAAATGKSPGMACTSAAAGPITADNPFTVYSSIDSASEVDQYMIRLEATTNVIIDVESFESPGCPDCYPDEFVCGFRDYFGNGEDNDKLSSNIFLFDAAGTVVDFKSCYDITVFDGVCNSNLLNRHGFPCYPGCDAPGAFCSRSGQNPYMSVNSLAAGNYIFAIGASILNPDDAWNGLNTNGSTWSTVNPRNNSKLNYNNYRITFEFN